MSAVRTMLTTVVIVTNVTGRDTSVTSSCGCEGFRRTAYRLGANRPGDAAIEWLADG